MRLNWKGCGQKHYYHENGILRLHWRTLLQEHANVYCIKSLTTGKILLLIRIYDFAWQESL